MVVFLRPYAAGGYSDWSATADAIAISAGEGPWLSRRLHEWVVEFAKDDQNLPTAQYGKSNSSILEDEDLTQEIFISRFPQPECHYLYIHITSANSAQ